MKLTKSFIGILLVVITLASCSKTEKVLVKQDGKWNIDKQVTTTTIGGASTTDTQTDIGVATFNDGTGVINYNDGTTSTFDWSVVDDVITITYTDGTTNSIDFTILSDSGKDFQHWSGSYTIDFLGTSTVVDIDITLSSLN